MKKELIVVFILCCFFTYSQDNTKVDYLVNEIKTLNTKVLELKKELQSELSKNGYYVKAQKKNTFSTLRLKENKYGKTLAVIKEGSLIKVLYKTYGFYKVVYNDITGFINESDLKIEETLLLIYLEDNYRQTSNNNIYTSSESKKTPTYSNSLTKYKSSTTKRKTYSKTYYRGPRGGCYYINSKGNKSYVARSLCN